LAVSYACRINGIDKIVLTKPDVLDGLEEVRICTGYKYKGSLLRSFPPEPWILEKVTPQYKNVPGWKQPVHGARDFARLPRAFKDYLRLIEDFVGARAVLISTGVEREDTIFDRRRLKGLLNLDAIKEHLPRPA
jgi:adenylosuccinate synthase